MSTGVNRERLHHSHAHEEDIPGTVNLSTVEGDDVAYGQALFPVPALDPNDPLQWPNWKKVMILVACVLYSFLGNSALIGISPYFGILAAEFNISVTIASNLISYPNLCFGFGSLFLAPMYMKFGRRPVMLGSQLFFICGLIGTSQATTWGGLMGARCVAAFGAGICEALPVQLVNDIFFLHERGKRIGYYTAALCWAAISPLPAGYMLNAGKGWQLYFYVLLAFAIGLFIFTFLVVEETSYDRKAAMAAIGGAAPSSEAVVQEKGAATEREHAAGSSDDGSSGPIPARKTFAQQLSLRGRYDPSVPFFTIMWRSFTYFLVPQAVWVMTSFGIYIGLGAFVMNYISPTLLVGPPYLWPVSNSGLASLGAFLGYVCAVPFSASSDQLAARLTRRNGGIREAEMRLGVLLVPMLVGPAGLIVYGFTAERHLHWIGLMVGQFLVSWASYFYFSFTIAYAVDSYFTNTSEMLIALNIGKQAISFGFGFAVLTWVEEYGYIIVIGGIFTAVLLANNLMTIVFMVWGKRLRRFMATTWLARLHGQSVREAMTH